MAQTHVHRTMLRSAVAGAGLLALTTGASAQSVAFEDPLSIESAMSAQPGAMEVDADIVALRSVSGEDFETFPISSLLGRDGWWPRYAGAYIADRSDDTPSFGERTLLLPKAGFTVPHGAERRLSEPTSMRIEADVLISGVFNNQSEGVAMDATDTAVATMNTRVLFRRWTNSASNGDILVLQALSADQGEYIDTGWNWSSGVETRLGIEVLAGHGLHVYVNGQHVFAGHDIVAFVGLEAQGTNRLAFTLNGGLAEVMFDNVTHVPVIASDFTRDGAVDSDDLATLLQHWGANTGRIDIDQSGAIDGADLAILLA